MALFAEIYRNTQNKNLYLTDISS